MSSRRKRSEELERFLGALSDAGYQFSRREGFQPTPIDLEDAGGQPFLTLLVYLWLLRGSPRPWRRELRVTAGRLEPDIGPQGRTLLLGYDTGRDVFAAWQAKARPLMGRASLSIPETTLAAAEQGGIVFHRSQSPASEVVTAFRPDALPEYLDAVPSLESVQRELAASAALPSLPGANVDLTIPPDSDPADVFRDILSGVGTAEEPAGAVARDAPSAPASSPGARRFRFPSRARTPRAARIGQPRKDVATGFAKYDVPSGSLDRFTPLERENAYLFWFEIGAVAGSIEETPSPVPAAVPDEARLVVRVFEFDDELEIEDDSCEGVVQLERNGGARVVSRAATVAKDEELHRRRLFFPIRTPPRSGDCRLRCNLYFGATLVQSRLVKARVGGSVRAGRAAIRSTLDYSLTRKLAHATLARLPTHRLSIQLNGASGTHQFRIMGLNGSNRFSANPTIREGGLQNFVEQARGALRKAAWGTKEPWRQGVDKYHYSRQASDEQFKRDLTALAFAGYRLYDAIVNDLSEARVSELEDCMRTPSVVQIAASSANMYIPAGLLYDYPIDERRSTVDSFELCERFKAESVAGDALGDCACFQGNCPSRGDPKEPIVCPSGFWGFRHEIGWPLSSIEAGYEVPYQDRPHLTIGVSTTLALYREHSERIKELGLGEVVESPEELYDLMRVGGQHLVYLYCHGGSMGANIPYVEIGPAKSNSITRASLRAFGIHWKEPRPLVFLNGCQTTALEPDQAINLVSGFVQTANALGVVGTEITVFEPLACTFAEAMLTSFMNGSQTIGASVRSARLQLLQDNNPLGLVYVPFVAAGARLVPRPET